MKKTLSLTFALCIVVLLLITCKKKPEVETYNLTITNESVSTTTTTATITADFSFPTEIYDIKVVVSTNSGMGESTIIPTTISGHTLSVTLQNLTMNTKYYYCYRYSNNVNMVDTDVKSFTTLNASQAIVTTGEVSDITKTTAQGHGNVSDDGEAAVTERGVCWSTSHNPTIDGSHANNGTGTGEYTVNITGLTTGTTYYVRAYAKNSIGTSYGNEVSFTTLPDEGVPSVTTAEVTNITKTSAKSGGNVTSDGGATVTERGICWSLNHNPTIADSHHTNGSGTGTYTISMTGLTKATTYYVRAYAKNSVGISYGNELEFTTLADLPTVSTVNITNITEYDAVCGGIVIDDGGASVTARGVCYGTNINPTIGNTHTLDGIGVGSFVSVLSGLTPNTTYYIRAYATNSVGTSYGEQKTFVTAKGGWLYYGNNSYVGAIGLTNGGTMTWASMFPTNTLSEFTGTNITKIKFYVHDNNVLGTYTLNIYRGGTSSPTTLIHTQNINVTSKGWIEVPISPLELVITQTLWVSLSFTHQSDQYPACYSIGVNDPNARWIFMNSTWQDVGSVMSSGDGSWMIRTYVTSLTKGNKGIEIELPQGISNENNIYKDEIKTSFSNKR